MINTRTLRQIYRRERREMKQNYLKSTWILGIIVTVPAIIVFALMVKFSCIAIVAIYHIIK